MPAHEMDGTIPTFSISSESEYLLSGSVNGIPASILVDTGAATTVLAKEVWDVLVAKTPEAQLTGECSWKKACWCARDPTTTAWYRSGMLKVGE